MVAAVLCLVWFGELRLFRPTSADLDSFLRKHARAHFNAARPGVVEEYMREGSVPSGYLAVSRSATIGRGAHTFNAACDVLMDGKVTESMRWARVVFSGRPRVGDTVATCARCYRCLWSVNPCRLTEVSRRSNRATLTYRTLVGHLLRGEESFEVVIDHHGEVVAVVTSVSRADGLLGVVAMPLISTIRRRFLRDAAESVAKAGAQATWR